MKKEKLWAFFAHWELLHELLVQLWLAQVETCQCDELVIIIIIIIMQFTGSTVLVCAI